MNTLQLKRPHPFVKSFSSRDRIDAFVFKVVMVIGAASFFLPWGGVAA